MALLVKVPVQNSAETAATAEIHVAKPYTYVASPVLSVFFVLFYLGPGLSRRNQNAQTGIEVVPPLD
jgi:hypothetical protein